jgi:GntR family transcriptional regulator, transcriptional repressor for pyruvate dehydrogenase complex
MIPYGHPCRHPPTCVNARRRDRIPQLRIAESVAAELRTRILHGQGADAYRLPTQDRLMEEFGVSLPSIREAIRILETEGLVTVRRGNVGGAEVHQPDEASAAYHLGLVLQGGRVGLGDLARAIQLLEPMCAAGCAQREDRATEVVPLLAANVETSATLVTAGTEFGDVAREFHGLVVALVGNATIRHVVGSLVTLWAAQEQAWAELLTSRGEYPPEESEDRATEAVAEHRRLVAAIEAGDAVRARAIAHAHLAEMQDRLLQRFGDGTVLASSAIARQAFHSIPRPLGH